MPPMNSLDDDDPYDADPPADRPSFVFVLGVWLIFGLPLLLAVPAMLSGGPGGFDALLRVIAGAFTVVAGIALWHTTRRYVNAPRRRHSVRDDEPDEDDEEDWDDAEEL